MLRDLQVEVHSDLQRHIQLRTVGLVPGEFHGAYLDDNVLRTTPGLFPDPLFPVEQRLPAPPGQWRSIWVTVRVPARVRAGIHEIELALTTCDSRVTAGTF
jgi:hypothetical protein